MVARGADITDYIKEVTGADGEKELVTIARSGEYTYTFAPSLVSLPSKEAVDGEINTANPGDWLYDVKEVYTGAVYTVVTADTQTAVIPANDVVSVAFTNGYDNTDRDGGVVINQFDYNADSGWGWMKVTGGE